MSPFRRLWNVFRRPRLDDELRQEFDTHLALIEEEEQARGLSAREARERARARFGSPLLYRDRAHDAVVPSWLDDGCQDIRLAIRSVRRSPTFAAVAVLTLALGIGASTVMFSIVNSVLLRPLPYPEPDALVRVYQANPRRGTQFERVSLADFQDLHRQAGFFAAAAAYDVVPQLLTGRGDPVELAAAYITDDFFDVMGVPVQAGRPLNEDDYRQGAPNAIISDRLWRMRFAASPTALGSSLTLRGEFFQVVGVMPATFSYPTADTDVWIAESVLDDDDIGPRVRDNRVFESVARMAPGANLDQVQTDLSSIAARLAAEHPQTNGEWSATTIVPLRTAIVGDVGTALVLVLGVVGTILLISCVNLASLLLARGAVRSREIAIRSALGAGRGRIVRQLLTESVLLSLAGGATGVALSIWGLQPVLALIPLTLPRLEEIRIDARVVGFGFLLAVLTGLLFGLVPALRVSQARAASDAVSGRGVVMRTRRLRSALVVAEVALALVLVIGATLMARSLLGLRSVDPGFNPDRVLIVSMRLHFFGVPDAVIPERLARRRTDIIEGVARLPGVAAVGMADQFPLRDRANVFEYARTDGTSAGGAAALRADTRYVSADYIRAMGIPLRRGQPLPDPWPLPGTTVPELMARGEPFPMLISDSAARRLWPDRDPIGHVVDAGWTKAVVVGIVGDVRQIGLATEPIPAVYLPQMPRLLATLVVRTTRDPAALADPIRRVIRDIAPDQPIGRVATMNEVMWDSIAQDRFFTALYGIFAGLALLLAAFGVYGLLAYSVGYRTKEIGVRIAVGARAHDVLRLIVVDGMLLVTVGVIVGVAMAAMLTRVLQSQLYGITATDPIAFVIAPAVLIAVALIASYLPARRATRIDPIVALHHE
jgi:putative ABC transport system permease protein